MLLVIAMARSRARFSRIDSAFPASAPGRRHIGPFRACSSFTRVTACQVARPPFCGCLQAHHGDDVVVARPAQLGIRHAAEEFQKILTTNGLARIRLHDLRHTAATLLLAQGVHPRLVMELLGHSPIAVTMNTYSHVVPELRKETADRMDAILKHVAGVIATASKHHKPQ